MDSKHHIDLDENNTICLHEVFDAYHIGIFNMAWYLQKHYQEKDLLQNETFNALYNQTIQAYQALQLTGDYYNEYYNKSYYNGYNFSLLDRSLDYYLITK